MEAHMLKLTDTQLVILASAAKRADGAVFPLPKSLKIKGGAVKATLARLCKDGLLTEQPARPDAVAWREDADRKRMTLVLTKAGVRAIGAAPSAGRDQEPARVNPESKRSKRRGGSRLGRTAAAGKPAAAVRKNSKQALLLDLLKRNDGASLTEIAAATGWQLHSIRGAISGTVKSRLGLDVASKKVEGRGRVYRIAAES
jgi:DNA-binding MarR family transcriptional regulator